MTIAAAALASAAIVGVAVWALTRPAPVSRPLVRLQASTPVSAPPAIDAFTTDLALSPDGTHLAYMGGTGQAQLYVRTLDQNEATPLAGIVNVRGPFFSPDGEWVAYFQASDLKKVSIHGGPSVTICQGCGQFNRGASWGSDDTIIFTTNGSGGLQRVPAGGGDVVTLATPDTKKGEQAYLWPEFLPGGQAVLFTILTGGAIENAMVAVRDLKTGAQTILVRGGNQAHFAPSGSGSPTRDEREGGHLVYAVAGTLRAVSFDPVRLAVAGNPVPVLDHVLTKSTGAADFSVARNGSMVYVSGDVRGAELSLVWIDRQGREEPTGAPPRTYVYPRLSPDGQRVALDVRDQENDIWIWDFARHVLTRLTIDPGQDTYPTWTPDGQRIVFASTRTGVSNLFSQPSDGTGVAERLTTSPRIQYPWAFTPDGKSLVIRDTDPKTGPDLGVVSMEGDHTSKPLVHTPFVEQNAELSADGRWMAYQSNESGQDEIYVRPFPAVDGGHWQVSAGGGARPLWARSGRELFFVDPRGRVMTVPVQSGSGFAAGNASVAVESVGLVSTLLGRNYDVSPDGKRFLIIKNMTGANAPSAPAQLNVILNWDEELKRLAPAHR